MNYKIIAKYIKNLNFNISKPDKFFSLTKDISNYKFKIDIKSHRYKDSIIEVQTTLALEPKDSSLDTINALVTYSTLVELDKDLKDKQKLEQIILIDIPNEIYPELRKVFIFIFENSGFREIKIDEKVDFKKLYLSRKN
tara:strand:- start:3740 stop:4156 length:417 start_codon:yes stop_codon:yes gene_type:complete